MAEHNTLTGAQLHDVKGAAASTSGDILVSTGGASSWGDLADANTGAAAAGQILVSEGSGVGSWKYSPLGWGYYQDNGSAQVFNTTAAKVSIDGAGSLTNEDYLPYEIRGTGSLWDTTNDKITPIRLGDSYDMRLDLPITAETGAPTELTIEFDISGAASPTTVIITRFIETGKTTPYTMTVGFPILALSSTTVTNGIQLFAKTDTGTVTITNPSITIVKNVDGLF